MKYCNRKEAKANGMKRYFTGKPCKHGHVAERSVANGCCVECQNRKSLSYYHKTSEKRKLKQREWYWKNREERIEYMAKWRAENREYFSKYFKEHADRYKEHHKKYLKEAKNSNTRKRRALLKGCEGSHTHKDIENILHDQGYACNGCQCDLVKTGYQVDHIMPVARMGTNSPENLQALCPSCNQSKGFMHPIHWYISQARQAL